MYRLTIILVTVCLLAPTAAGQPGMGAPGSDQVQLIDRISTTRLALERIADAAVLVRTQRDQAARQHETLAKEIRQLKKARKGAGLLPDFALQSKLRRSQELAEALTLLNRELEALRLARLDRLQQLAMGYEALIGRTAARAKEASGQRQADLVALLEQARRELAVVHRQLTPVPRAPREMDGDELLASEDPEELSERADSVRDEQDRLRRELAHLNSRHKQLEREARLDRDMRDFISEQEIFDEGSRVLVPRGPAAATEIQGDKNGGDPSEPSPDRTDDVEGDADAPPGDEPLSGWTDGAYNGGGETPGAEFSEPGLDASTSGGRLPEGVAQDHASTAGPESADDLQAIGHRRAQIVDRLKKLQRLHDRMLEKIEDLERE